MAALLSTRSLGLALLPALCAWLPLAAQSPDTSAAPSRVLPLVTPGSPLEGRIRVQQLLGEAPAAGFLIRSTSTLSPAPDGDGPRWALVAPELRTAWNSGAPFSLNDGALWAGRGVSVGARAGAVLAWGPLTLTLAPEVVYAENREFEIPPPEGHVSPSGRSEFIPYWQVGRYSLDLPLRFGSEPYLRLDPGQSTLALRAGRVVLGASTEDQWWGPGIRNAIVLSNNAPGIPRLFLGTAAPLRTRLGEVEARWMAGALTESAHFDSVPGNGLRSLSALAATLRPAFEPGLTLGVARAVYAPASGAGGVLGNGADVLTRWPREAETDSLGPREAEQIFSLFGRWLFPRDGVELYFEWARHELPATPRELLAEPQHTQGYTLGMQWARPLGGGVLRLQPEVTYLERSSTFRRRPMDSFYASRSVPQGYTQRGEVVGAAIGPGASSQWLAADYLRPGWEVGLFAGRIRWNNDAYYSTPRAVSRGWAQLAHDVSVFGGIRGGVELPWGRVDAELATGERMNFLFQNWATSWQTSADSAVDVRNHTLRLTLTPGGTRLRAGQVPATPARD